jgi:L-alanine-DL-glutamate epimerase-like enolase superfamily enzyme
LVTELPPITHGTIKVPSGAGLGTRLDPELATRENATARRTTAKDISGGVIRVRCV